MKLKSLALLLMASSLCTGACGLGCAAPTMGARPGPVEQPRDVTNYFLVVRDTGSGDTEHVWQSKTAFDWRSNAEPGGHPRGSDNDVVFASGRPRNCEQEQIDCFRECYKRKPRDVDVEYHKRDHYQYCERKCLDGYMECLKATQQHPAKATFTEMNEALAWLKRRHQELVVGAVIVVAGVAFVVVAVGGGLLVLSPI